MDLPSAVRTHQTVWIDVPGGLGDDGLSGIPAGTKVTASVGGLADGPLDAMFWVYVRELDPDSVSLSLLSDLVGDRALGRTSEEVVRSLEGMRASRRLVALEG